MDPNAFALRIVKVLNMPFSIKNNGFTVECRTEISSYPIHGENKKILIRNTDKAMYQAKAQDQAVFVFDYNVSKQK